MKTYDIKEIYSNYKILQDVSLTGWVRSARDSGSIIFLSIFDGTTPQLVQVVIKETTVGFNELKGITTGSAVFVSGKIVVTEGKKQAFEIQAGAIENLKKCSNEYPLQKKEHSLEFLREISHLRPRTSLFGSVFRIRSKLAFAIHQFFQENGFLYVHSPIITANDAEGAGESFSISVKNEKAPFFGKNASLTVSGQLNAEAFAQAFKKVYTFGPTFRAEKSFTNRHVSEFWMIEPEVAFIDLEKNIKLIEAFIKSILVYVKKECEDDLAQLDALKPGLLEKINNVIENNFEKIKYEEAIKILNEAIKNGHRFENNNVSFGTDLASEHEKYLAEIHFKGPVFITNYPKEIKAFYMKLDENNRTVSACDLLVPGIGEIVGGSQREDDYEKLLKRCQEMKIVTEDLKWYLELRNYGYYQSSGFGLGFERILMYITGIDNIRDVIPFARTPGAISF